MIAFYILYLLHLIQCGHFIGKIQPSASPTFQHAASLTIGILNRHIVLNHDIHIFFSTSALESGVIGRNVFHSCTNDLLVPYTTLPAPIYIDNYGSVNACSDSNLPNYTPLEVTITNKPTIAFYAGDDISQIALNEYDLPSAMLHEVIHGLGFTSSVTGECTFARSPYFTPFDVLLFNVSYDMHNALSPTQCDSLTNGQLGFAIDAKHFYPLYSTAPFVNGESTVHSFFGIMNYKHFQGHVVRSMDAYVLYALKQMGYKTINCEFPDWSNVCGYCDGNNTSCIISGGDKISDFAWWNILI